MKKYLLPLLLVSTLSFADDNRHMVSVTSAGLGWSGAVEKIETDKKSVFSDLDYFLTNISFNYAYRLNERFQVGGFVSENRTEYKFHLGPKKSGKTMVETQTFGIFGIYNFSDTISSAWYTGLSISHYNRIEETSHNATISEGKNPFELDDTGQIGELFVGKRFRLNKWNIQNITYAPQFGIYMKTHGKDFDDMKTKDGFGISFQPVKFDVLF